MTEPNFENTEIAFKYRDGSDLRMAYWLFWLLGFPSLVKNVNQWVSLASRVGFPVEWFMRNTVFPQFCGGENLEECMSTVEKLKHYRVGTILDYSVEGNQDEGAFNQTADEILRNIELSAGNPWIPFCVFKFTGIARFRLLESLSQGGGAHDKWQKVEWERARQRVEKICQAAADNRVRLFVDAEESWIQKPVDDLVQEMMEKHNRKAPWIFNTVQMYRTDRLDYLRGLIDHGKENGYFVGVKIVRGAYMEKERAHAEARGQEDPILPSKEATDKNFDLAVQLCLENLGHVSLCAGTHNEASTAKLVESMKRLELRPDDSRIFFAQLLGMSDHISFNLASEGYNVAKYVPYGPIRALIPYLCRRAEENTSVMGQSGRELKLLQAELRRRRVKSSLGEGSMTASS